MAGVTKAAERLDLPNHSGNIPASSYPFDFNCASE